MFLVLAIVSAIGNFVYTFFFGFSGEKLTLRLRVMTITALLNQEIGYFDDERNSTGILTSKLADDATRVEGLTGALMGQILFTLTCIIAGLVRILIFWFSFVCRTMLKYLHTLITLGHCFGLWLEVGIGRPCYNSSFHFCDSTTNEVYGWFWRKSIDSFYIVFI